MKLRVALVFLLSLAMAVGAVAQTPADKGSASDLTNTKLAKLDLLIKLVPLALQKSQYEGLLTGIENARQIERDIRKKEDADLAALDPIVSEADQNGVEKGVYPPRSIQDEVAKALNEMRSRRLLANVNMIKAVWDQIKAHLNDGQIKAMAGSFADQFVNSNAKPGEITQEVKVRFFINAVFLDPLAYDLLVDMSKHAS